MKRPLPDWLLKRSSAPRVVWEDDEVQVIRDGDEVTVIVLKDIHPCTAGLLIDCALIRAGLHPNQVS